MASCIMKLGKLGNNSIFQKKKGCKENYNKRRLKKCSAKLNVCTTKLNLIKK